MKGGESSEGNEENTMQVVKYRHSRFFAVYDAAGELVVVTVYKRGAQEIVRRLTQLPQLTQLPELPQLSPSPLPLIGSTREVRQMQKRTSE